MNAFKRLTASLGSLLPRPSASAPAGDAAADARRQRDRALLRAGFAVAGAVLLMVVALILDEGPAQPSAEVRGVVGAPAEPVAFAEPPPTPEAPPPTPEALPAAAVPTVEPSPAPSPAPAAKRPAQPAPAALADGYRVQLGVFGDPANAAALQAELDGRGLPAHIQSRVVLGPFENRAQAERAQAQLRKAGAESGVVVAPARQGR